MPGILYIVSTPIGNLADISLRAITTLRKVDLIVAEDTRNTKHLLTHYRITTPFAASYYDGVEQERTQGLLKLLEDGKDLALVSDAGTPLISDPGYPLVRQAIHNGIKVVPVPGAAALLACLVASGLPTDRFAFDGAFPRRDVQRRQYLQEVSTEKRTTIVHSTPHRLLFDLEAIAAVMPERNIVVAREVTKIHEEFLRGTAKDVLKHLRARNEHVKGECVLIVEGAKHPKTNDEQDRAQKLASLLKEEKIPTKVALQILMLASSLKRNDAYSLLHKT
jgi:16S rRNA (cytidine1402-2'-O)-methyltransferase